MPGAFILIIGLEFSQYTRNRWERGDGEQQDNAGRPSWPLDINTTAAFI